LERFVERRSFLASFLVSFLEGKLYCCAYFDILGPQPLGMTIFKNDFINPGNFILYYAVNLKYCNNRQCLFLQY
jgi:hypothetical protein